MQNKNTTPHTNYEQRRRDAKEKQRLDEAEQLREKDAEQAYKYANRVNTLMSPIATLEAYAKTSGEYDGVEDEWSVIDEFDGVDGAAELSTIVDLVYQDPTVELTAEQKQIADYVTVDAQRIAAKSAVNFEQMKVQAPDDTKESYPYQNALAEVVSERQLDLDTLAAKTDRTAEEQETLATLRAEVSDLTGFTVDHKNKTPRSSNAMRNYLHSVAVVTKNRADGGKTTPVDRENIRAYAESVQNQYDRNQRDANVYRILAEAYPFEDEINTPQAAEVSPTTEAVPVAVNTPAATPEAQPAASPPVEAAPATPEDESAPADSPEVMAAREVLDGLRTQLAELQARREKRLFLADGGAGEASFAYAVKELKAQYHRASQKLCAAENHAFFRDNSVDMSQKILRIAEHTIGEAAKLDGEILESYNNNDSKVGKFIKWYGKRGMASKLVIGAGLSIGAGILTGGVGTALVSGSLMATGLEASRRKKRGAGDRMVQVDVDELAKHYMADRDLEATFDSMHSVVGSEFEERIDSEQKKRGIRVLGSFAAGAVLGTLTHNLAPHMDGLFGGDSVNAAPAPGAEAALPTPEVPTPDIPAPADIGANFSFDALNVQPNEGLLQTFQEMGVPQQEWSSMLDKVGSQLVNTGDAYWMPNGDPGWSNAGQLSQAAIDILQNAR